MFNIKSKTSHSTFYKIISCNEMKFYKNQIIVEVGTSRFNRNWLERKRDMLRCGSVGGHKSKRPGGGDTGAPETDVQNKEMKQLGTTSNQDGIQGQFY